VRDRELYVQARRRFLELKADRSTPVFLMLATVESHFPFGDVPPENRVFPGEGLGEWERYCNSIHHADASLQVLLDSFERELESGDMLLVLTADHSYPVLPAAEGRPETACDEVAFRIPWILHGGRMKSKVRRDLVSQVDIAPTLLDCLSLSVTNHFMGRSVLRDDLDPVAAVAFQPGDGGIQVCTVGSTVFLRQVSSGGVRWLRVGDGTADGAWSPTDVSKVPAADRRRIEEAMRRWDTSSHALATDRVWPKVVP
jgi:phosphoglycerol transferase MdoB-like AlkP superfamily enzyme